MKKVLCIIVVVAMSVALLCGCASTEQTTEEAAGEFTVELEGNATTGYQWLYTADPEGIVEEVSNDFFQGDSDGSETGVGGVYVYKFKGVQEGETTLTFVYARSWEDEEPGETVTYKLSVDADGNITEVK